MKARDQEWVAFIAQHLKDRTCVLSHQNGMGRVVVDAELIADAVPLADAVERNPGSRRVGDVVEEAVRGGPARHRTLLDAILESARLRLLQQWNEGRLEVD